MGVELKVGGGGWWENLYQEQVDAQDLTFLHVKRRAPLHVIRNFRMSRKFQENS